MPIVEVLSSTIVVHRVDFRSISYSSWDSSAQLLHEVQVQS